MAVVPGGTLALDSSGDLFVVADYSLVSLNAATGEVNWSFKGMNSNLMGSIALGPDGTVYAGTSGYGGYLGSVDALNPTDGSMLWQFQSTEDADVSFDCGFAVGTDGTVYADSEFGDLYALDGATGAQKWAAYAPQDTSLTPAIDSAGVLYISNPTYNSSPGSLTAIDGKSGKTLLKVQAPNGWISSPAIDAAGDIYAGGFGTFYAFSKATISNFYVENPVLESSYSTRGVVQFSAPGREGYPGISLSCSSSALQVPSSVDVPAGSSGVSFPINSSSVRATETVTITAAIAGTSKPATVTLTPSPIYRFYLSPASTVGGQACTGVVQLPGPAGSSGQVVALLSGSAEAQLPASVTVPANQPGVSFQIHTSFVSTVSNMTLAATLGSYRKTATLTLNPNVLANFYVSPPSIVSDSTTEGVIQLQATAVKPAVISLSSSDPAVVVPSSVTIPIGSRGVSFSIRAGNIAANEQVTLTATYLGGSKQAVIIGYH